MHHLSHETEEVARERAGGALAEVVAWLTDRLGEGDPARAVASVSGTWDERLERALAVVGVRTRWLTGPAPEVAPLARVDLPVVTRGDDGRWWVLDGYRLGWVHAVPIGDPRPGGWLRIGVLAERAGEGARPWALVEPKLPASALTGPGARPVDRLRALLATERPDVQVVAIYAVAVGLLSLATPLTIQVLINWLAFGGLLQPVVTLAFVLLVCLSLAATLSVLQRLAVESIERRLFVRVAADLVSRLSRVRLAALDGASGPELANRFFDVATLQKAAGTLLLDGIGAALQLGVAVLILALYHPWLLLFDVVLLVAMFAVLWPHVARAEAAAIGESKAKYAVAGWIEEVARHPLDFRLCGATVAETRADELARYWLDRRADHFRVFLRQLVGARVLQVVASAALLVTCGSLVLEGELTLGQLVAAEFIVTAALAALVRFTDKLDTVYDLLAGVDKLGVLADLPPEPPGGVVLERSSGPSALELRGVRVGGVGPLDVVVPAGARVALVGEALVLGEVLVGARTPDQGEVWRDGQPLDLLAPEARYGDVLLLREDAVWAGSIRDTLARGHDHTDAELWDALERVGLATRIRQLPGRLDAPLGPGGSPLRAGEAAALQVAAAALGGPRLVVVDGLLDGLGPARRATLLDVLAAGPWTLVLLTAEPALAARCAIQEPVEAWS
jgi:putative ABC transport system ATP-binding protein